METIPCVLPSSAASPESWTSHDWEPLRSGILALGSKDSCRAGWNEYYQGSPRVFRGRVCCCCSGLAALGLGNSGRNVIHGDGSTLIRDGSCPSHEDKLRQVKRPE